MRLNKKMEGGFVGPICGAVVLGIAALGVSCPQVSGVHAADNLVAYAGECSPEGVTYLYEPGEKIAITRTGEVVYGDLTLGSVTPIPLTNEEYESRGKLICKNNDGMEFTVNVKDVVTADDVSTASGQFVFEVESTTVPTVSDSAGQDDGFNFEVDVVDRYQEIPDTTADTSFDFIVEAADFVQITKPETWPGNVDVAIELNPGSFGTNYADFNVAANRGYEIHVTADQVNLQGANGAAGPVIAPIDGVITADDNVAASFGDNTWGYSLNKVKDNNVVDITSYRPIATTISGSDPSFVSDGAIGESTFRLTCGAKVGTSLPADDYSTTVTISAVIPADAAARITK